MRQRADAPRFQAFRRPVVSPAWVSAAGLLVIATAAGAAAPPSVRAELTLNGPSVVYTYTVVNGTEAPVFLDALTLATDESPDSSQSGAPKAPAGIPCHALAKPFAEGYGRAFAVSFGLQGMPIPPGGEIGGLAYRTGTLPTIGEVVLDPAGSEEREALLSQCLKRGAVPTDEALWALQRRKEIRVTTLVPAMKSSRGWELWDRFEADLAKAPSLGWFADPELLDRLLQGLLRARSGAAEGDAEAMIDRLLSLRQAALGAPPSALSPEARSFVSVMALALATSRPDPRLGRMALALESGTPKAGEIVWLKARLERWGDAKPMGGAALTWEITDESGRSPIEKKDSTTREDGSSLVWFKMGPAAPVKIRAFTADLKPNSEGVTPGIKNGPRAAAELTLGGAVEREANGKTPQLESPIEPLRSFSDGTFNLAPERISAESLKQMIGAVIVSCGRKREPDEDEGAPRCSPIPLCLERPGTGPHLLSGSEARPLFQFGLYEDEDYYPLVRREGTCVLAVLDPASNRSAWIQVGLEDSVDWQNPRICLSQTWESDPSLVEPFDPSARGYHLAIDPYYLTGRMWRRIYAQPDPGAPWLVLSPGWSYLGEEGEIRVLGRENDFLLVGKSLEYGHCLPLGWIPIRDSDGRLTVWYAPHWC